MPRERANDPDSGLTVTLVLLREQSNAQDGKRNVKQNLNRALWLQRNGIKQYLYFGGTDRKQGYFFPVKQNSH